MAREIWKLVLWKIDLIPPIIYAFAIALMYALVGLPLAGFVAGIPFLNAIVQVTVVWLCAFVVISVARLAKKLIGF